MCQLPKEGMPSLSHCQCNPFSQTCAPWHRQWMAAESVFLVCENWPRPIRGHAHQHMSTETGQVTVNAFLSLVTHTAWLLMWVLQRNTILG